MRRLLQVLALSLFAAALVVANVDVETRRRTGCF